MPGEAPTAPPAPPHSPRAARASGSRSRLAAGRGQVRWSAHRGGPRRPPNTPPPCGFLSPQPTRACSNPTDAEESAPTWTGAEQQQEQERAEQHPWPPQPGEGSQRRRHSAGLRGHAPRPPRSRCPPACPRLLALPTPLLDARSLGFPFGLRRGVAWRGVARRGRRRVSVSRRGRRTDTRSQEAGGPRVRPGGGVRRRLEGAGAAEWTAPPLPAWGLLSTSGPWSGDREVGAAGGGRRQEGGPWRPWRCPAGRGRAPPDNAPGGQAPAEGLRPAAPPPLPARHRRGQSHKGRASRPRLPPGPLSRRLV